MWRILKDGSAHNPDTFERLILRRGFVIYSLIRGQELVAFFKSKKEAKQYIAEQVAYLRANEELK
ncbi:MAG: hypothetical protein IJQ82_08360 [Selenomonadaceae bacterium]|nr:hypothetical protein [Selenomonadaceae bacterium]